MKILHGIISVLLNIGAAYMFFFAKQDQHLVYGFILLLMAMLFLCFMMLEEKKQEVEQLRKKLMETKFQNN